jgi:RNA polymerase sigma factor (sigma-70 family)
MATAPDLVHLLAEDAWARRLARALVRDAARADDLVQEAYARTLAGQAQRGDAVHAPRAWFARVIGNLHREWRRSFAARDVREQRSSEVAAERSASPDELVARAEVQQLLATAVLALEPRQRELVLLHHFEGVTVAELAARAEVSRATMHDRLERAHAELRRRLAHLERDTRLNRGLGLLLVPRASELLPLSAGAAATAPATATTLALAMSTTKLALVACVALTVSLALWRTLVDGGEGDTPIQEQVVGTTTTAAPEDTLAPTAGSGARAPVTTTPTAASDASTPTATVAAPTTEPSATEAQGATIAGVVVDADGQPVAGARVWTGAITALRVLDAGKDLPADLVSVETDSEGRFALERAEAGPVRLTAAQAIDSQGAAACSETLVVQLAAGERHDDVRLVLRRGATIHGVVFDPRGAPSAGRAISLFAQALGRQRSATSDLRGVFEVQGLEPGRWTLQSLPTKDELEALGLKPDPLLHAVQANVVVADGERREVLMGAPPAHPVVVSGTVRSADGKGAPGMLQWMPEGEDPAAHQKVVQSNAEGRFEVTLPMPGRWQLGVHAARGRIEALVSVPPVERFEHDIVLPSGTVAGRVVDEEGQPVTGVEVTLHVERGTRALSPFSSTSMQKRTDKEGRYEFLALTPATYTVVVHGRAAKDDLAALALAVVRGIVVPVEAPTQEHELEVELVRGRALSGHVVDEHGFAVDQGVVFLRDADGNVLNPTSTTRIDGNGHFTTPPLGPGDYSVAAWVAGAASVPSALVTLAAASAPADAEDTARDIELVVCPAAIVLVGFGDLDPSSSVLSVRDDAGREHANLLDPRRPWDCIMDGFGAQVQRIGPLPPGRYIARGFEPSGREGTATFEVQGAAQHRVDLATRR